MTRDADSEKNSRKYLDDSNIGVFTGELTRGPYQNNGATPWFSHVPIGTTGQFMKMAFDTGSNFMWVTSTLCAENGNACQHYGNSQFNYHASTSFTWVDQNVQTVDFGPWGSMVVKTGSDVVGFDGLESGTTFYLSENYSGEQFQQLDWDGGIGLPSGTAYAKPGVSFVVGDLFNAAAVDSNFPYVCFDVDIDMRRGSCILGGYDLSQCVRDEYIYFPWTSYDPYPPVNYMWNSAVASIDVAMEKIATNQYFCLDTGSSRFKGDPLIVDPILEKLAASNYTDSVELTFAGGTITVPPSVYMQHIEAGPDKGKVLPQFESMPGLDQQLLAGSVLMDHLYTIFGYTISGTPGDYTLEPRGMWLFNKVGGLPLISTKQTEAADIGSMSVTGETT